MALAPHIAERVAHLWDASVEDVLSGAVPGRGSGPRLVRDDVDRLDTSIAGVRVRRYRPAGVANAPRALVWAHGGGWRYGGLDMPEADSVAQVTAAVLGWEVVSVDYRMAPAHRHPAGSADLVTVCASLIRDEHRVVLGGASAGAHLAGLAVLELRDRRVPVVGLWLVYPASDPLGGPYGQRHPDCPPVVWTDADAVAGMFSAYLGIDPADAAAHVDDVTLAPGRADLRGLPPTLVTTAEVDALEPQGRVLVARLVDAGVDVEHHHVESVMHGYLDTVGGEPLADAALTRHLAGLAALVGPER